MITREWSADAKMRTRSAVALENASFSTEGLIGVKNVDGRFGAMHVFDLLRGNICVLERGTDAVSVYVDKDSLIVAGWATEDDMNADDADQKLKATYSNWRASLRLGENEAEHLSPPLLLSVPTTFAISMRRVLFVGQETFGWSWTRDLRTNYPAYPEDYASDDLQSMHDFLANDKAIDALMWSYRQFDFAKHQPVTRRSPFWQAFREVQAWSKAEVIWRDVFSPKKMAES